MNPDQHLIAKRFNQRATAYHGLSPIQQQMAQSLTEFIPTNIAPQSILEIGCGTGHLTRLLMKRYPQAEINATDVAENMLRVAADLTPDTGKVTWTQAEADLLAQHAHEPPPELIVGNAVLQWLPNPQKTVADFAQRLPPGGCAAFAIFGPSTFRELQGLLAEHGIRHPLSMLPDASQWKNAPANVSATVHSDRHVHYAADSKTFLRETARSGAALPTARLSHGALRQLLRDYDAKATPNGIPITWERIFVIMKKES